MILTRRVEARRIVYCKNPHHNFWENYHPLKVRARSPPVEIDLAPPAILCRKSKETKSRCVQFCGVLNTVLDSRCFLSLLFVHVGQLIEIEEEKK
jgi:hypothetical protein